MKIAAIGGGTGLSTMLRGLKRISPSITAIVTVMDNGGGSGVLRQELGMLPPGDIRNCLQALANTEPTMEALLAYRFQDGALRGQSFGNLFLAALNGMCDTFDEAVARMSEVLAITGRVLPVTNENVQLLADFDDGVTVTGESQIAEYKKDLTRRIVRAYLSPEHPAALPACLDAIREADLIVLNKIDLLDEPTIERYMGFLHEACPDIPAMKISAKDKTGIPELAEYLTTHETALKNFSVRNNQEFADAEAKLTWYNRRLYLKTKDGSKIDCNAVVDDLIEGIRMGLIERKRNVPHLKTFATSGNGDFNKASLIGVDYDTEYAQEFLRDHKNMRMIINARAVCESRPLARLMDDALDEVCDKYDLDCQVFFTECFGMADEGR